MSRGRAASGGVRGEMDRRLEGGTFSPQDPLQHLSQGIRMSTAMAVPLMFPAPSRFFLTPDICFRKG